MAQSWYGIVVLGNNPILQCAPCVNVFPVGGPQFLLPGTDIGLPIGQFRCVTALLFPLRRGRVLLGTSSGPTCPPAGTLAWRTTRKSSVNAFAGAWYSSYTGGPPASWSWEGGIIACPPFPIPH